LADGCSMTGRHRVGERHDAAFRIAVAENPSGE
jgi:hypothetical protein